MSGGTIGVKFGHHSLTLVVQMRSADTIGLNKDNHVLTITFWLEEYGHKGLQENCLLFRN